MPLSSHGTPCGARSPRARSRCGRRRPLPPGGHRLFHQRFERIAARHPDRPALTMGAEELSYGQLDARANRLAHRLRGLGVAAESVVAISLPRGTEAIVSLLGVLKAGGAYLWVEPSHPFERRRFLLEDAGAEVLVALSSSLPDVARRPASPRPQYPVVDAEAEI